MLVAVDTFGVDLEAANYLAVSAVGRLSMHPLNYAASHGDM
jgi:hypothetical protein